MFIEFLVFSVMLSDFPEVDWHPSTKLQHSLIPQNLIGHATFLGWTGMNEWISRCQWQQDVIPSPVHPPECLSPYGISVIPGRLELQWGQETQLMREPLCGTSSIVMSTISESADLFSLLYVMHEAGGWKSILMPVSGVRWTRADIGNQKIRAVSLDPILAKGFLQAVIDVDPQPLISFGTCPQILW